MQAQIVQKLLMMSHIQTMRGILWKIVYMSVTLKQIQNFNCVCVCLFIFFLSFFSGYFAVKNKLIQSSIPNLDAED